MSLALLVNQTGTTIDRARLLFAGFNVVPATDLVGGDASSLIHGTQVTATAEAQTSPLSGRFAGGYRGFAERAVTGLDVARRADATLAAQLTKAAALERSGCAALNMIAAEHAQTRTLAAGAHTPAAQRAVVTALRSQAERIDTVVATTLERAKESAGGIQAVDWKTGPASAPADPPTGPGPTLPYPPPPLPDPGPVPEGKEWHYYMNGGWRLEDKLEDCSAGKEFWTLAQITAGLAAMVFGGPLGFLTGLAAAGHGIYTISNCAPPGS